MRARPGPTLTKASGRTLGRMADATVTAAAGSAENGSVPRTLGGMAPRPAQLPVARATELVRADGRPQPAFRDHLDVATNSICTRCVCSLKVGLRTKLW